ncbi:putative receptor-like protein kinase [Dorcoceras hygrometricum]|uniref:Putative receptor-like protein kinase n=1 Tax=Dorcoceras hygrometricum TaxID=472368 RepID=A0A2Z7BD24_9LAMI|nr:putative receptor-like protein kinase [Dorcoceras hygrometricum]
MASCIPEPLRVTQVLDSRFPHGYSAQCVEHTKRILGVRLPKRPPPPPSATSSPEIRSGQLDEENPSAQISSGLLVQADEGIPSPVVDLDDIYRRLPSEPDSDTTVGAAADPDPAPGAHRKISKICTGNGQYLTDTAIKHP